MPRPKSHLADRFNVAQPAEVIVAGLGINGAHADVPIPQEVADQNRTDRCRFSGRFARNPTTRLEPEGLFPILFTPRLTEALNTGQKKVSAVLAFPGPFPLDFKAITEAKRAQEW